MKFFQCMINMQMHDHYNRYNLFEGQLIRATTPELIKFFENHRNVREINDEKLKRLSPPLHMIKQPEDPYRMRKEDVIKELRSYGIAADIYTFSDKLSMQLQIARKMKKRNFLTVLDNNNRPVFVDKAKIPVPSLNNQDEELSEPDIVEEEYYEVEQPKKQEKPKVKKLKKQEEEFVAAIDPIVDEEVEKNKGKMDFTDWISNETQEPESVQVIIEEEEIVVKDEIKKTEVEKVTLNEKERQEGIENDEIIEENYRQYIETDNTKPFVYGDITYKEKEEFRVVKWTKISIPVLENVIRNEGLEVTITPEDKQIRWPIINAVKDYYETLIEKDRFAVMINMLQKRYNELVDIEPQYRKFKNQALRKRVTQLTKYGISVWYDKDTDIRSHAQKVWSVAKLGLDLPDTEEGINELLNEYKREGAAK
jgi:hypothetical protein